MNRRQKAVLIGMVLGDAYLQKTGKANARIRLEHSQKQKDYLVWKAGFFPEFFQGKPQNLSRFNNAFKKTYDYVRWQSNASPEIGKYQKLFYKEGQKTIPKDLSKLLNDRLSLAIWYMDDGYLYQRDKIVYIYLPKYSEEEQEILLETLKRNFNLSPQLRKKKTGNWVLIFTVEDSKKFFKLIAPFVIPSLSYKLLNPVSTAI